jgi:hypothetical protein
MTLAEAVVEATKFRNYLADRERKKATSVGSQMVVALEVLIEHAKKG